MKGLMRKLFLMAPILALLALAFAAGVYAAKPSSKAPGKFSLPERAKQVAPAVYYLGKATHNGRTVEGYAFVDFRKGYAKPGTECGNGTCEPGENARKCPADCDGGGNGGGSDTSGCYGFLAKGAKWKSVEPYIVNPSNTRGLSPGFVTSNLAADIGKWESAATFNVLGDGSSTSDTLVADTIEPDDTNEVYFADIAESGAIGVTIVWGYFSGPPWMRELIEWDQVYDDSDFDWSSSGEAGKMDFENIATHELGHSVGLDDLYDGKCSEMTMYGYGANGETKKRDLEDGDINGVTELYQ